MFYEVVSDPRHVPIDLSVRQLDVLVQPTRQGFVHPCTPQDLSEVLRHIPVFDLRDLSTIVLRQPTRKQAALSSVWGRLVYSANLGRFSVQP